MLILNRDPAPLNQYNASLPPELNRIIGQALEKDRDMRYQSATDLKTALKRLKRDLSSGQHATTASGTRRAALAASATTPSLFSTSRI